MPHFEFDLNDDGSIKQIYKDGKRHTAGVSLELPNSIPKAYLLAAAGALHAMNDDNEKETQRSQGIQCFLMAMVGLEAFINVFFHLRGHGLGKGDVIDLADSRSKTIEAKLSHLPYLTYGEQLPDQKALNRKARELYDIRSGLAHPKLVVSSLLFSGVAFDGMVENSHRLFEDKEFAREALRWCLLIIARIGLLAQPNDDGFVLFWTGLREDNEGLSASLGVSSVPGQL